MRVSAATPTLSSGTGGCAKLAIASQPFAVGDAIVFTGSGALGSSFDDVLPPGFTNSKQPPYYVISADYSGGTFDLSLTPGGACIAYDATVAYIGSNYPVRDVGGLNVYLLCALTACSGDPTIFAAGLGIRRRATRRTDMAERVARP